TDLISQHVADETMVVACAPDHQWAGRSLRNAEKLWGECWIAFPVSPRRQDSFAHLVLRRLAAIGLDDAEILYIDSLTAQKRLVEAGYGLALLPASSIQEELKVGSMAVIDALALRVALPVFAVWRKRGFLSSAARTFLSTVTGRPIKPKSMLARSSC